MASSSFRDSMNSLGWSRRADEPVNTAPQNPILGTLSKLNPFASAGYVRLPTTEGEGPGAPLPARTRREEEEGWFARKSTITCCCMHTSSGHAGHSFSAMPILDRPRAAYDGRAVGVHVASMSLFDGDIAVRLELCKTFATGMSGHRNSSRCVIRWSSCSVLPAHTRRSGSHLACSSWSCTRLV